MQPQAKLKEIKRILALWPSQAGDDGDELLRAYLLAAEDYPADDVTSAVDTLVKGTAPGVNPSFRPKPSELGAECRRQMNMRLDRVNRANKLRPALPPPDIERTPESQAKVRELVEATVNNLKAQSSDESPQERHRRIVGWANERIDAERGYSVGDPEGAADAA